MGAQPTQESTLDFRSNAVIFDGSKVSGLSLLTGQLALTPSGDTSGATDAANLQALINAADPTNGTTLIVTRGTYYFTPTLKMNNPCRVVFDDVTINVVGGRPDKVLFGCYPGVTSTVPWYSLEGRAIINANYCGVIFDAQNISGGDSLLRIRGERITINGATAAAIRASNGTSHCPQNVELSGLRINGTTYTRRTTTTAAITTTGSQSIPCGDTSSMFVGQQVRLDTNGANDEFVTVTEISDGTHFTAAPAKTHASGIDVGILQNQAVQINNPTGRVILDDIVMTNCGNGAMLCGSMLVNNPSTSGTVHASRIDSVGYGAIEFVGCYGKTELHGITGSHSDTLAAGGGADGIDISDCYNVTAVNCTGYNSAADGIACENGSVSQKLTNVLLVNCTAYGNGGPGITAGANIGTERNFTYVNCVSYNNNQGQNAQAIYGSGFTIGVPSGVTLEACRAYDDQAVPTQLYGLAENAVGNTSTNVYRDCNFVGNKTGAIEQYSQSIGFTRIERCNGYNPVGSITPPSVPASGSSLKNPYSQDVLLGVTGGTVTQIQINGVNTNMTSGQFLWPFGTNLVLTYSAQPALTVSGL